MCRNKTCQSVLDVFVFNRLVDRFWPRLVWFERTVVLGEADTKDAVRKITSRAQIYLQTGLYIVLLGRLERKYCQQAEISFSYTKPKSVVYFFIYS